MRPATGVIPPVSCRPHCFVEWHLTALIPEAERGFGGPKIALRGGGGWHGRPAKEGGGAFQKWASVPGPLFCVRTVVAAKGAGTQILARKYFFEKKFSPTYV